METFWYRLTPVHLENGYYNREKGKEKGKRERNKCYYAVVCDVL